LIGERIADYQKLSISKRLRAKSEQALSIVESLRTKIASQGLRSSYFATVQKYYDLYVDILMRLHKEHPAENFNALALQTAERARARSLLETLGEARHDIRQGVDQQLLERERNLQRQLNTKDLEERKLLNSKHTAEQAVTIKKELDNLTIELEQVEAAIRQKSPRYAALTQPQPLSLKEIQTQVLDSDTLLLEYSLGEDKSYLWAVTLDSITSYELPKRSDVETAAKSYYELLAADNRKNNSVKGETKDQINSRLSKEKKPIVSADTELSEAASRLSQIIIAPVAAQLGTKRLLIVADGALQYIPFAALPETISNSTVNATPNNAINAKVKTTANAAKNTASQPLVFNHEIVSLPSASTLAVLRREFSERKPAAGTIAVVADPVFSKDDVRVGEAVSRRQTKTNSADNEKSPKTPVSSTIVTSALEESGISRDGLSLARLDATRTEANSILALAPVNMGMKALSFQASRSTVTSGELARYRIVHFATHGLLNSEHPELSGIVLSLVDERGEPQDGFLRLHEIYNLKLPAELIVLSACQTALGKEIRGEGLVGLTRGFMYAGSPRVVASLWKVDDAATRDLMKSFYREMLTGKLPPAAALRQAQIEMAKQKIYGKPYYWAAFVLQGEWK
jgi:CHAT domain-containing protein